MVDVTLVFQMAYDGASQTSTRVRVEVSSDGLVIRQAVSILRETSHRTSRRVIWEGLLVSLMG